MNVFKIRKALSLKLQMYRMYLKYCLKFSSEKQKRLKECFAKQESLGITNIPIFIINFNRLDCLKLLIKSLEMYGYNNIHIIDNASTYPPLLQFYAESKYDVIRMEKNEGHLVFWKNEIFTKWRTNFYVVTDPDVIPVKECPSDFLRYFFYVLKKYPFVNKVGFSLKIDDLLQMAFSPKKF